MINKIERPRTPLYIVFAALLWTDVFGIFGAVCVILRRDKR
jgi:hypothetical protein